LQCEFIGDSPTDVLACVRDVSPQPIHPIFVVHVGGKLQRPDELGVTLNRRPRLRKLVGFCRGVGGGLEQDSDIARMSDAAVDALGQQGARAPLGDLGQTEQGSDREVAAVLMLDQWGRGDAKNGPSREPPRPSVSLKG
jgi:hypothetical protein